MKSKSVLISGASIAGLTAAYWLNNYGFKVTVIEIAETPRDGGSPVDIKGKAIEVAKRMNLLEKLRKVKIDTERVIFINNKGSVKGSIPQEIFNEQPEIDIELPRSDLVRILYEEVFQKVKFLFGNKIINITEKSDDLEVAFANGITEKFDLVIGADGLHSGVRKLVFGSESKFTKYLGMYAGLFEVDAELGKENTCVMQNSGGKLAAIYSYKNKADALLVFRSKKPIKFDYRDIDHHKKLLIDAFKEEGGYVPGILDILNKSEKLYFDSVSQIKMQSWSKGRVAFIGDAAYCASFLTGAGSTLAMTGAAVLAEELNKANGNHKIAFQKYDEAFRPFVEYKQRGISSSGAFLVPKTKFGIWFRNSSTSLFPVLMFFQQLSGRLK